MSREYKLLEVPVKGWTSAHLPKDCADWLNKLASQGWKVEEMTPLQTGISGTTTIVFLLVRES